MEVAGGSVDVMVTHEGWGEAGWEGTGALGSERAASGRQPTDKRTNAIPKIILFDETTRWSIEIKPCFIT